MPSSTAEITHPSQTLKRRALQAAGQKGPHGTYHCAWICLLCTYPRAIAHEGLDKRTEEVTPPLPDAAQLWALGMGRVPESEQEESRGSKQAMEPSTD